MKKFPLFLFFALAALSSIAQERTRSYLIDPALAPRDHNVQFTHMRLDISFAPEKSLVKGKVMLDFTTLRSSTDSIWLDGIRMRVQKITLNGKEAKYRVDTAGIVIYPPAPLAWESKDSLEVTYECNPRRGLFFIGWNDPNNISRKEIWSQGEGTDNRNWIPMFDSWNDKMITETLITFDKDYQVLSNGTKLGVKDNSDGTKTWHYSMTHPHSPYLVMIGIGKYGIEERKSKSGVPLHLYYYPEWKDRIEPTYEYSAEMIDFYEKEIGVKYGWESYSQIPVQDFLYGAMENTTATIYGDFFLVDKRSFLDRNYISVNAHELAHQWFGDLVTCRTETSMWLHENFATYYSALFDKELWGKDYFDWERRGQQNSAIDEFKKNTNPIASSMGGTTRLYPQGAFVLNMLKYVVGGRDIYNKAIKYYLERHKYENVDSRDLLIAFEESTGMSLDWFWEEWYFKGGIPNYNVSYAEENGNTVFTVAQVQELTQTTGLSETGEGTNSNPAGLFKMPIWFEVHYTDGTADKKQAWIEKQTEKVSIPNSSGKKIDYVLFDPDNQVMKQVSFHKPVEMLQAQASKAENLLDRIDALEAMRSTKIESKRDFLISIYNKETFHAAKDEVIGQLANDSNSSSRALIKMALADKDVQVRKAALAKVHRIPAELLPDFEKLLSDSSYDVVLGALDKLANTNPAGIQTYLEKTKGVIGTNGRNVEIKWLELSAENSNDNQYINKLVDYTSNSYEFITRDNAMFALKRLNYFDTRMLANLIDAAVNSNGRLSGPAMETLQFYYSMDKYRPIIADYVSKVNLEPWQKAAIRRFGN
jgi:aminopeptidase N